MIVCVSPRLMPKVCGIFVLCLLMTSCGTAEWPPSGNNASSGQGVSSSSSRSASNLSFVGASAVRVGDGDTLYAISRRHKVGLRALIEANNLRPPFTLQVGQRLVLPHGHRHRVVDGDTVYAIAQKYDADPYETARINGLKPPYVIHVDDLLLIPGDGTISTSRSNTQVRSKNVTAETLAPPSRPSGKLSVAPKRSQSAVSRTGSPSALDARRAKAAAKPVRKPSRSLPSAPIGSGFVWPVEGRVISGFGVRKGGLRNDGINILAPRGTPVRASDKGVVAYVGNELRGFGNLVLIKHNNGWISAYAHTESLKVSKGDKVRRGQRIANVGVTGGVNRPQLHFELRRNKRAVDPRKHLGRAVG